MKQQTKMQTLNPNRNLNPGQSSGKMGLSRVARARWANRAPSHVREMFIEAIDAFVNWNEGEPEPTLTYEVNYVPYVVAARAMLESIKRTLGPKACDSIASNL